MPPCAGEALDGANKYKCPKQQKAVRAVKRMTVDAAPNVLMIQLKRFEFSFSGHKISKKVGGLCLTLGAEWCRAQSGKWCRSGGVHPALVVPAKVPAGQVHVPLIKVSLPYCATLFSSHPAFAAFTP